MDQAITRAAGATPRTVGEFQGFIDGEPSVVWADRKNMPQVGDKLFVLPCGAAAGGRPARTWSILLTSGNRGLAAPVGHAFGTEGEKYERVQVMEIVEAGAPPAPGVDLPGLVRLELTNEQIAAGAIVRCDHGGSIGRSAAIEVWDAMLGVAPIAAQAGQAAVPEWISVDERLPEGRYCLATYCDRAGKLRIIRAMYVRQFEIEASGDECDSETNEANDLEYLKAGWYEMIDNWGEYSSVHVSEGPVTHWTPLPPLPDVQASTAGGRQEGGAA